MQITDGARITIRALGRIGAKDARIKPGFTNAKAHERQGPKPARCLRVVPHGVNSRVSRCLVLSGNCA